MTQIADVQVPPSWDRVGRHGLFPEATHDETARYNFLSVLNRHLAGVLAPGVEEAYETRVLPAFQLKNGRSPKDRHEVRRALLADAYFQDWSALRRNTMEMRQQAGRSMVLRQAERMINAAREINAHEGRLQLDPRVKLPAYLAKVDHHCMPGSYHTELTEDDVTAAANYDSGLFVTTGGALGPLSDGGGRAVAEFVKASFPDFQPKRILDLGCGLGHNAVPLAQAFPEAEVIAVDTGAPMLRYGAARAASMGVKNIVFVQANAEDLDPDRFAPGSFDWVQTTMFWHETSGPAMRGIMKAIYRLLTPGGLTLHVEQPQYGPEMKLVEQALRDWDAYYNNEPFWSAMHGLDERQVMRDAGFTEAAMFHGKAKAKVDNDGANPASPLGAVEDRGRAAAWDVFGAWKN